MSDTYKMACLAAGLLVAYAFGLLALKFTTAKTRNDSSIASDTR